MKLGPNPHISQLNWPKMLTCSFSCVGFIAYTLKVVTNEEDDNDVLLSLPESI